MLACLVSHRPDSAGDTAPCVTSLVIEETRETWAKAPARARQRQTFPEALSGDSRFRDSTIYNAAKRKCPSLPGYISLSLFLCLSLSLFLFFFFSFYFIIFSHSLLSASHYTHTLDTHIHTHTHSE